ncbi:ketopantoate reductase family protein [Poritiphilus flavus]|uniref:2-dehydropantoate 2-reductase n=1 Tax=Poritiphilus flavus TaxID=2697053 RepID=A0A6L9E9K4_9FLAO|nr:2-dehydropantoate 2-reductase [Poritiphilus flavus]NAS11242.1 2-dehydropantoate 2-reductase [Poritiphilus flavus]
MDQKFRIIVVGIGGVGGYFGGLLAREFEHSDSVEVVFVARGEHLKKIQEDGLKVIQGNKEFIARPKVAVESVTQIGPADFILICTKTFDLEQTLQGLAPVIGPKTVLLPLLNGVDAAERIQNSYPDSEVWKGLVYIISRLREPGVVENSGNIQQLYFGSDGHSDPRLETFSQILKQAGIESTLSSNIDTVLWEKYLFISSMATASTYFDSTIGKVIKEEQDSLQALIQEVKQLGEAKGVALDPEIETRVLSKLKTLPYEATSSMHSDFQAGRSRTELEALTGYVVHEAQRLGMEVPRYHSFYTDLKGRSEG